MPFQETARDAQVVLDPGSVRFEGACIMGTFRGHAVVLEWRARPRGYPYFLCTMPGNAYGVSFVLNPARRRPLAGPPREAFRASYNVDGAPRAVLAALFDEDPDLEARILALPSFSLTLEPDRVQTGLPSDVDESGLRAHLDIAAAILERLPAAIQRSGAIAETGGQPLGAHPEVRALAESSASTRRLLVVLAVVAVAVFVVVPLVLVVGCTILFQHVGSVGPVVLPGG